MKPGTLTFSIPPITADPGGSALPPNVPSLIRLLMGLDDWPDGHEIRVSGHRRRAPLVHGRVATSKHVIDILFDPSTGRYECTNCQSTAFDLPWVQADAEGGFIAAVMRGLTATAAMALLEGARLPLAIWGDWTCTIDAAANVVVGEDESAILPGAVRRKPAV
jgi:hypothetical protein